MRHVGGHENRFAGSCGHLLAPDRQFRFPIQHLYQGIEGRRVLAQLLALIEREERDRPSVVLG